MAKFARNNLALFLIVGLVLVVGFCFFEYFPARASGERINIFPTSYSAGLSAEEAGWQNPEAAFSQDLGEEASFEEFNTTNSAYSLSPNATSTSISIRSATSTTSSALEFSNFGVSDEIKENKIENIQLRLSLAGKGEVGDKLIIDYYHQDSWQSLAEFNLENEISNATNGGYWLYGLPVFRSWGDLENLKIRLTHQSNNSLPNPEVYLDSLWLEVEYEEKEEYGEALVNLEKASRSEPEENGHSLVQTATGINQDVDLISATFSSGAIANNLLIAICASRLNVTINAPSGFTLAINESGTPGQGIFYKIATGGETTISCSFSGSTHAGIHIYEYDEMEITDVLDGTPGSATGTGLTVSSGSVETSNANDLLIAGMALGESTTFNTWTDGFDEKNDFTAAGKPEKRLTCSGADKNVTTSGIHSTSATVLKGNGWRGQIAAFKAVAPVNQAPSFSAAPNNPREYPACHNGSGLAGTTDNPVNSGSAVVFKATATDSETDNWKLLICKTNVANANATNPTCEVSQEWCKDSTFRTQGTESTCNYTTQDADAESQIWYAFACDDNSGDPQCTPNGSGNQGSGNSGSPFYVNRRPTFTNVTDDGSGNPGAADFTVTAATTISGTDGFGDGDTVAAQDTVRLWVCKDDAGFTGGASPECTGGAEATWCSQTTGVEPGNILTCDLEIPNPAPHGTDVQNYWPYVVDNHGLAGEGVKQGSAEHYDVNDVPPIVSGTPSLNAGDPIDLTGADESTTIPIDVTGIITDDNSCDDIVNGNTFADVYQYDLVASWDGCNENSEDDENKCYARTNCSYDEGGGDTCDGAGDKTASYKCTVYFYYYANPTDENTPWNDDKWRATLVPGDEQGTNAAGKADVGTDVEMQSFLGIDLTTEKNSISYGDVAASSHSTNLSAETEIRATGNCGLDVDLSGTVMTGDNTGKTIAATYQHYGFGASAPAWPGIGSLPATSAELDCCKSGYSAPSGTPALKSIWWGIEIPSGQAADTYNGINTIAAAKDEWVSAGDWCE